MKKNIRLISLSTALAALSMLSNPLLAKPAAKNLYCRSPMLYATNIRPACAQYGAAGMSALYQRSEFITRLKQANEAKSPGKGNYPS
ncbi:MAG: hypothetical protein ACU84Q_18420 [Gammaproteobacteria bacterium]